MKLKLVYVFAIFLYIFVSLPFSQCKSLKRNVEKAFLSPRFLEERIGTDAEYATSKNTDQNQRTQNLTRNTDFGDNKIDDELRLLSKIAFSKDELIRIKTSIAVLSSYAEKLKQQRNESSSQTSLPTVKIGEKTCSYKWKYYEIPMPIKGAENSVFHEISVSSILSVNCVAFNKNIGLISGQSDPSSGKFLYHWFVDGQKLVILRSMESDHETEKDMLLDEAIAKITIGYYEDCV